MSGERFRQKCTPLLYVCLIGERGVSCDIFLLFVLLLRSKEFDGTKQVIIRLQVGYYLNLHNARRTEELLMCCVCLMLCRLRTSAQSQPSCPCTRRLRRWPSSPPSRPREKCRTRRRFHRWVTNEERIVKGAGMGGGGGVHISDAPSNVSLVQFVIV